MTVLKCLKRASSLAEGSKTHTDDEMNTRFIEPMQCLAVESLLKVQTGSTS